MLRAIALTFVNEFRLLMRDRVGLLMLLLAPIVIIAVAGFSLGNIYGARLTANAYTIPLVDDDHGVVARAIGDALDHEASVSVVRVPTLDAARTVVGARDRAPLAVMIPSGTTAALAAGHSADVILYVDPIKRLEVSAIEFRVADLCRRITAGAQDQARARIAEGTSGLRSRLSQISTDINALQTSISDYQRKVAVARSQAEAALKEHIGNQMRATIDALRAQTQGAMDQSIAETKISLANEVNARRDALVAVRDYLTALQASEREFDRWFTALKTAAGSHASAIPPPPVFPTPPTPAALAELSKPINLAISPPQLPNLTDAGTASTLKLSIKLPPLPPLPALPTTQLRDDLGALAPNRMLVLPGTLGWAERSATGGHDNVNSFDQYVPGFGITFLLIGMLMGLSLGLIDERDWGTLARMRVSGAPLTGTLIGKLLARFLVGLLQMIVLLAVGYGMFGVSLGRNPAMLLLPAAAISFAAAAFGLIIACLARTHDSVMPFGVVVAMAMSAIGGCWWPLDFEPSWMRAFAQSLPTTWTMLAFNNLMIRDLPPASALVPSCVTIALGVVFLIVGLFGVSRLYD